MPLRSGSHRARLSGGKNWRPVIDLIDDQILRPASPPTVHQYVLKSRGNDNAFVIVKSHAPNTEDPPLLYFGEDITGYVILSLSDLSDMQSMDVVLQVFDLDPIVPWLEIKRALSSQQVDESHISGGQFCWPFTIAPPTDSISSSSSSADPTIGYQSLSSLSTAGDLNFQLIVTIYRRGQLTRNITVKQFKQKILYVPRPRPQLRRGTSPAQISVGLPGNLSPTSAPSMPSWPKQKIPMVIVRGVIFDRVNVEVECKLITPSEYLASDSIPLCLVLTSENHEALGLLSVPQAIDVRLQKVMAFGDRAGIVRPLTLRNCDAWHRAELAATANWVCDGDVRALPPDEHHRRSRWHVKLNGAFQRIHGVELMPSYEEQGVGMAIMYFVSFFPFRAMDFRPANNPNKELVISKIKLTRPS